MKKFKIIIIFIVILSIIAAFWFYIKSNEEEQTYITSQINRGSLIQTVSETGTVKALKELNLSFGVGGKLKLTHVSKGDVVYEGQILAELDYQSLLYRKAEAAANLSIARKNLEKLLSGPTPETIAVSKANVNKAESLYNSAIEEFNKIKNLAEENISQARKTLSDLESGGADNITSYEQAVMNAEINLKNTKETYLLSLNNQADSLLVSIDGKLVIANNSLDNIETILNDNNAENLLSVKNPNYLINTKNYINQAKELLDEARVGLKKAKSTKNKNDIKTASSDTLACLNKTYQALIESYKVLENSVISSNFTQSTLDSYKTVISNQQSNIATALSSVQAAEQSYNNAVLQYDSKVAEYTNALNSANINLQDAINSAKNSLANAEVNSQKQIVSAQSAIDSAKNAWIVASRQYDELVSPARSEDAELGRAQISQAEASLDLINKQIEDSIISSPIGGTVTDVKYQAGEQIGSNVPIIILASERNFEIEVDISEADIAKIHVGNSAEFTLDAFGDNVKFQGKVFSIDPAETVIQDVIYYKTKISFNDDNPYMDNIKAGMTANIILTTAKKDNILVAPSRAILEKNGDKIIRILENGELFEKPAEIGLKGDGGLVELVSGAKEGDVAVTYINEKK